MQRVFHLLIGVFLASVVVCSAAYAQDEDTADVDSIANEIGKAAPPKKNPEETQPAVEEPIDSLSDLARLAPFSEVSVIQRRFLPKTNRFQFFGGLGSIVNDPWFLSAGPNFRLGYYFVERWGIELSYFSMNSSQRDAVKELQSQNSVSTSSIVTAKTYAGADIIYTPIYGKIGRFNRAIVPFDMYFAFGGGATGVIGGSGGSTFHAGVGQIFGLSKSLGVRWDFSWNYFTAKSDSATGATLTDPAPQSFNNLILSVGASFFFPGAKYR